MGKGARGRAVIADQAAYFLADQRTILIKNKPCLAAGQFSFSRPLLLRTVSGLHDGVSRSVHF